MSARNRRWIIDAGERAGRTFLQAYFGVWFALGADFDHLFVRDNIEGGVVGLALSLAVSVGARRTGADDSASLLPANVDPPQPDAGRTDLVTVLVVIALGLIILALVGVRLDIR